MPPLIHPYLAAAAEKCFLPIIYEDENLLVLNKASGTPSIPHHASEVNTAVNAALAHCPKLAKVGRGGLEPGILHRLDTGTSGLLVFAKSQAEFERLREAWKKGEVKKYYLARVSPRPSKLGSYNLGDLSDLGSSLPLEMNYPLAHDAKSSKKMVVLKTESQIKRKNYRGKPLPAITRILAVQKGHGQLSEEGHGEITLEIEIKTGVMHQIRCHLAALGLPIVGDKIYKGAPSTRLGLHAWRLVLPLNGGKKLKLEAGL